MFFSLIGFKTNVIKFDFTPRLTLLDFVRAARISSETTGKKRRLKNWDSTTLLDELITMNHREIDKAFPCTNGV